MKNASQRDVRPRSFSRRWTVDIEFDDPDRRATFTFHYVVNANDVDEARDRAKDDFFTMEGRTLPIGRGEWRYTNVRPV